MLDVEPKSTPHFEEMCALWYQISVAHISNTKEVFRGLVYRFLVSVEIFAICCKERELHCWDRGFENVRFARSTDVKVGCSISPQPHRASILARIRNGPIHFSISFELENCGENRDFSKQECQKTGSMMLHRFSLSEW